jgi:hypothetical protein
MARRRVARADSLQACRRPAEPFSNMSSGWFASARPSSRPDISMIPLTAATPYVDLTCAHRVQAHGSSRQRDNRYSECDPDPEDAAVPALEYDPTQQSDRRDPTSRGRCRSPPHAGTVRTRITQGRHSSNVTARTRHPEPSRVPEAPDALRADATAGGSPQLRPGWRRESSAGLAASRRRRPYEQRGR